MKTGWQVFKNALQKLHLTVLQRMFFTTGCLMLALCIVFFSIFNYVYRFNLREILSDEMQSNLDRINEYIDLIITDSGNVSGALSNSATLQRVLALQHLSERPIHANTEFRAFFNLFSDISNANEFIASTDLYIQSQHLIMMSNYVATTRLNDPTIAYLDDMTSHNGDFWISTDYDDLMRQQFNRGLESIAVVRPFFSSYTGEKLGFIATNIRTTALQRILHTMQGSECVLLDEQNRLVVDAPISEDCAVLFEDGVFRLNLQEGKGASFQSVNQREFLIVSSTIESVDWRVVSFTPTDRLMHRGINLQTYLVLMNVALFLLLTVAMMATLRQVAKRVRGLVFIMNRVKIGDFALEAQDPVQDEFSFLFTSFHSMVKNLEAIIHENYHLALMHKDEQLRLLQSQVNPHFLYNIFNNMHWMIKLGRYEDLDTLVRASSVFYSRSLNDGKYLIRIGDIVEKLKSYVQIQQIRFQNRFTFHLEMEEDLLEVEILNHLVQPLLENAIIHGVEPLPGLHRIAVTGRILEGAYILLQVQDDGAGIPSQKLEEIHQSLELEEVAGEFFAIKNVHRRIQMFYGPAYGLSIESEEGRGTLVTLRIPYPNLNRQEMEEHVPHDDYR